MQLKENGMLKAILATTLRTLAERLEANTCQLTEQETFEILDALKSCDHSLPMSKDVACKYLHLSRSTFDKYIREGIIPKG